MKKMQQAITSLLFSEPFYGHLVSRMHITVTEKIPTAGVFITNKINLTYNESWFESLDLFDAVKVLKHECEHILREHISRASQIGATSKERHKRFNIATDVTINVKDLLSTVEKIGGVTVNSLNKKMKEMLESANLKDKGTREFKPMKDGQMAEYYYNKINEFADENLDLLGQGEPEFGETMDDHSTWDESDSSADIQKEISRNAVNDAVKISGGIGALPGDIAALVSEMNKSSINWKQQLRQFYVNTLKSTKIATRKRRNRRYGILQPGIKRKPELHIGLCVDTSGSVSDTELEQFWSEIDSIHSLGVKITVIEGDAIVQAVYEYSPKKTPSFKGRAGTMYNPCIQKAKELKVDAIIHLGDGDMADIPLNPNIPFIWAIVRDSPAPADFGRVVRIEIDKR